MRLYGHISKVTPEDDGTVRVEGIASSEAVDEQGEIVRADAIRAAIPDYMRFPALREMHQLSAAGTTIEADVDDEGITRIVARVVDPVAIAKVKNLVYRGFSIGGRVTKRDSINNKIITGIQLNEISLVDRPANPEAILDCWKAAAETIERTDDMESGLATLGDTPVGEALAAAASNNPGIDAVKTAAVTLMDPVQIWACGDNTHSHIAKGEATRCIEKRAAAGENGGTQWEPKPAGEAAAVEEPGPEEPAVEEPTEKTVQVAEAVDQPEEAEQAVEDPPEAASEAEADAGTAETVEADPSSVVAEKTAQEPSEAEQALAKAAELAERARAALKLPAAADETSETASEGFTGDEAAKAGKDDGDKKDKPYGDVEYADPGYQADGKKRYPIDTAAHIRAAWNYINQEKNCAKYGDNCAKVKAKIVAAWKSKIDKDGPPSAAEKAAVSDVAKSLSDALDLVDVIVCLDEAQDRLQWEAMIEEGESAPAVIDLISQASGALRARVAEEAARIGSGQEVEVNDLVAMAEKAGGFEPWLKSLIEHGFEDYAELVKKAAGRHSAKNQEMLDMAYECASRAANLDGCSKAATDHFDSASKCMMAAGAKGWDTAKKASSEGMMIDALAKGAQHMVLAAAAHDCIGKIMSGACCTTKKASKEDKENLTLAHDHLVGAGATCDNDGDADDQKVSAASVAEGSDQLSKVQSENAQLLKAVQEFAPLVERLLEMNTSLADQIAKIDEKVDRIDQQEAPPRGLARSAGLFALSKGQDNGATVGASGTNIAPVSPEEILKSINALPESKDKAFLLMQIAHTNPRPVRMVSQAEMNLPAQ